MEEGERGEGRNRKIRGSEGVRGGGSGAIGTPLAALRPATGVRAYPLNPSDLLIFLFLPSRLSLFHPFLTF
jgi:hypothetical protein